MTTRKRPDQATPLGVFFLTYYGYVGLFASFVSLFFAARGISAAEIGILMALMQVTRIFGPNMWGALAARTGRRVHVMRMAAIGALLSFLGMFWASNFYHFFALMLAINFFTSAHGTLSLAALVVEIKGDMSWYGPIRSWGSIGYIVAVFGGGKLLDSLGIAYLPAMSYALLFTVLFACYILRESEPTQHKPTSASVMSLMRKPEVFAFFVSAALMIMAHSALYVFYSLYLEKLGYGKTLIGGMWAIGVIAEIVVFYFQAPLFQRFGVRKLMLFSLLVAVIRFLMIGVGAHMLWLLILAQLLHAITFGIHNSATVMQVQRWFHGPLQDRGQALLVSIPYGIGGTLGGIVAGYCWDIGGAHAVFFAAALIALIAFVAAWLSYRWIARAKAATKT